MAFSSDAIGFYLQAEDQLTPTLAAAAKGYRKFVNDLESWNKRAFKTASKGFGQLQELVHAFDSLPEQASKSYTQALKRVTERIKPITQPLSLVFSAQSKKQIQTAITDAITKAMSNIKLRLNPAIPAKKLSMFDSSVALRALYKKLPQPPDLVGTFHPPKKFKHGGPVTGGTPGQDSVLSLLEPGEFVLPKDVVDMFKGLKPLRGKGGHFISPKEISESLSDLQNLTNALQKMNAAIKAGFGSPQMATIYKDGLKEVDDEMEHFLQLSSDISYQHRVRMAPAFKETKAKLEALKDGTKEASNAFEKFFEKIVGPVRFLAISKGAEAVVESLHKLKEHGTEAFEALGGEQIQDFTKTLNKVNARLHLSRSDLRSFKQDIREVAKDYDLNINEAGEAVDALAEAGARAREEFKELTPAVTSFSRANKVGFEESASIGHKLSEVYKFSGEQIAGFFLDLTKLGGETNVKVEELVEHSKEALEQIAPALVGETTESKRAIITSLADMDATMQSQWEDTSGSLQKLLAEAAGGQVEALQRAGMRPAPAAATSPRTG